MNMGQKNYFQMFAIFVNIIVKHIQMYFDRIFLNI